MAFTVETGALVADANSLVSLADATTYHADRGNSAWAAAASDAIRQAALIKATDYIQQKYQGRWKGELVSHNQALDWPRQGVSDGVLAIDYNVIPARLKQAVSELALEALTTTLNAAAARGGMVKRVKVDVIEKEFSDYAPSQTLRPAIDGFLKPYLFDGGSGIMGKAVRV